MKIANGIEMLEIAAAVMGGVDIIHPTLLWDKNAVILVDTGYPGLVPKIREAMERTGVPFNKLNKVIITHQDLDHIGSLPAILSESVQPVEVIANEIEKPYIHGEKMLIKITPEAIDLAIASLPANVPTEWRDAFRATLENPPKAQVDTIVEDGQVLPDCGGIIVIHTPGHTPGHISLYHKPSKTLIAADAMIVKNGQLFGPEPQYSENYELAIKSLKKLAQFDIEAVICYHGGIYKENVNQRIKELTVDN